MGLNQRFHEVFRNTPIIGVLHLAGSNPVKLAIEELDVFAEEGLDGALIENYHCRDLRVLEKVLEESSRKTYPMVLGVNVLPNEFHLSMPLAARYQADFVQLDFVAGKYERNGRALELDVVNYEKFKIKFPQVIVLGGVWPKYYKPAKDSILEADLVEAMQRAEGIIVTGQGTGVETPMEKIRYFKAIVDKHPLLIGAGLNVENAHTQLLFADGALVGSALKVGDKTHTSLDRAKIRDLVHEVVRARTDKKRG